MNVSQAYARGQVATARCEDTVVGMVCPTLTEQA
jgi:hypothetical protein